jgi:hypothetical protein
MRDIVLEYAAQCKLAFPPRLSTFVTQPFPHGVVNGADSVTDIVLKAMSRTSDPRLREIMASLVKHLHAFVREARPTEEEFETGIDFLMRVGQASGPQKNEMILLSDLLGLSTLVVLLNNKRGKGETDAALLGPFWREHAPICEAGESIARDPRGGEPLWWTCGRLRRSGFTKTRTSTSRTTTCADASRPMRKDDSISAPCAPRAIPFPPTARVARCCARKTATRTGPRTSIS